MADRYYEIECEACGKLSYAPADGSQEAWDYEHTSDCRYFVINCLSMQEINERIQGE